MTSSVSLENTDTAIATSADIARLHLARIIGNRNHTTSEMRKASLAVYGIRWNRDVLTTLSTDRINHDLARLRHSEFPEKEYERSPSFLKESYSASSSSPVELLEWRTLAAQIRLDLSEGWEAVLQAATFLHSRGLSTPFHLGALSPAEFYPLSAICPNAALLRSLWTDARATSAAPTQGAFWRPAILQSIRLLWSRR